MKLRAHPLMTYRQVPNWPPVWTQTTKTGRRTIKGEIGVLKYVYTSGGVPSDKCFLVIEHENEQYVGTLLFDNLTFCAQLCAMLQSQVGRSIQQIGDLDVAHIT